jgi:hypothetical protein
MFSAPHAGCFAGKVKDGSGNTPRIFAPFMFHIHHPVLLMFSAPHACCFAGKVKAGSGSAPRIFAPFANHIHHLFGAVFDAPFPALGAQMREIEAGPFIAYRVGAFGLFRHMLSN